VAVGVPRVRADLSRGLLPDVIALGAAIVSVLTALYELLASGLSLGL
jgi:hypothetical protein